MKKSVRSLALVSVTALALGMSATGGTAQAVTARAATEVLAKNLAGPLSVDVADDGSAYVTANFAGTLLHVVPGSAPETVYQSAGAAVQGVSVDKNRVVFTTSGKGKKVWQITGGADPKILANPGKYEKQNNPDAKVRYGFKGISKACAAKLPKDVGPANYHGIVESNPYATEIAASGSTVYLADAAGNDILSIAADGTIETLAVLPPTKVLVTKARAGALGLPGCTIGLKYKFEPVPTDVELGPDGWLYVSSLPGGPEDPSLGAQGRVYKVNPATGKVIRIARGLVSAVNVAVASNGDVYVAQLFTGQVSVIPAGTRTVKPFMQLSMPGAIEWTPGYLYATVDVLKGLPGKAAPGPKGKLVRIAW